MGEHEKRIIFCGLPARVGCDGKCSKAWGWNNRPCFPMSDAEEDNLYVPDSVPIDAPFDPGTSEGDDRKPLPGDEKLNRWCVRECERCAMTHPHHPDAPLELPDWSRWVFNVPRREQREEAD